jgi:FkbM family methyltransferase
MARAVARLLARTPLRSLPGGQAAYVRVYRALSSDEVRAVKSEGSWIYVDPRDLGVSIKLLTEGVFEPSLTEYLKRVLKPGMTVVDGGANIGYFTLLAARLVGDAGQVFAFEPEPANFDLLRNSVERNSADNVVLTRCALSDRLGSATLFLDRSNFGSPSLRAENVDDLGGEVVVETIRLDDFLAKRSAPAVDLIKLDAEGAEGLILAGAEGVLAGGGPLRVVMEFCPRGLRNMGTDPLAFLQSLREVGFEMEMLDERSGLLHPTDDAGLVSEGERRDDGHGWITLVARR